MGDNLRLLRYNTGTDKQVFVKFKDEVSAVIFNATIVAFSGSAVADLVSVHKNQYIIDPQTHIFQHKIESIQSTNKNGEKTVKKSVKKYLDELPNSLTNAFFEGNGELEPTIIASYIEELTDDVYSFETEYVNKYIKRKEYDKYLEFVNQGPSPRVVIAPYFMLKASYSSFDINAWMQINKVAAEQFIQINDKKYPVGVQLVLDRDVLERNDLINLVKETYSGLDIDYAFIWIDNYTGFDANKTQKECFKSLLQSFSELKIKPIMAYGGYDSILLCASDLSYRLYGVAHSVGYGESREITPVGGGLPVNKFYYPPLHSRKRIADVVEKLSSEGYLSMDKKAAAEKFYKEICSCKQCRAIIKSNIDNFYSYNDSTSFKTRNGVTRNLPTMEANLFSAIHYMYARINEWESVENNTFTRLTDLLKESYSKHDSKNITRIVEWCELYEE